MSFFKCADASFKKMISILALGIFAFMTMLPISAMALDETLIESGSSWYQKGESDSISYDEFDGMIKYYADEENGCVYFYVCFADKKIKNLKNEDIYLGFIIENSLHKYTLTVNKDGLKEQTGNDAEDNINVVCNFSNMSCKNGGGELFVGLELKNKEDKRLTNKIKCVYSRTLNNHILLKEDITLCMPATVIERTTALSNASKPSTTNKSPNETTQKQNNTKTETTKFSPSSEKTTQDGEAENSKNTSEKADAVQGFVPAQDNMQLDASASEEFLIEKNSSQEQSISSSEHTRDKKSKLSNDAKICLLGSVTAFGAGVTVIATAAIGGRYKIISVSHSKTNANEEL